MDSPQQTGDQLEVETFGLFGFSRRHKRPRWFSQVTKSWLHYHGMIIFKRKEHVIANIMAPYRTGSTTI